MWQRAASFLCVAYWLMLPAASAEGQKTGTPTPTVNASGVVVLHPKPTTLRLEMQLEAPGAIRKAGIASPEDLARDRPREAQGNEVPARVDHIQRPGGGEAV